MFFPWKLKSSYIQIISIFLAELIGTALLLFIGCMGCIEGLTSELSSTLLRSINFGLVIMILVNVFGCISGAYFNPAVTLSAAMCKLITIPMAIMYFVAQVIGTILGFGLLKAVTSDFELHSDNSTAPGLCTTMSHADLSNMKAVFVEFMLTAGLVFISCSFWDPQNKKNTDSIPLRAGFTIIALSIAGGPLTGASMNPARSLAPALWNNDFERHWVYWVGPMLAGLVIPIVYKILFWKEDIAKINLDKIVALNGVNSGP